MYTVAVKREFIAQHYLIGGDWGAENQLHSHHYVIELRLEGAELDQHGYLVDIVDVTNHLDDLITRFSEKMLNDQPEFNGLNPSLEHFARILAVKLNDGLKAANIHRLKIVLWENETAWAAYAVDRRGMRQVESQVSD